jgi:hypothetical protein
MLRTHFRAPAPATGFDPAQPNPSGDAFTAPLASELL